MGRKMWYQDYSFLLEQFEKGHHMVDETVFYFWSDSKEEERYIGFCPQEEKPYWAGLCDIPGGACFSTAKELFEARIYGGKSIQDRWPELVLVSMGGIGVDEIDRSCFA